MGSLPRHQCLIYQGSPLQHLPAIGAAICRKLKENYRCLYLNSGPMVAGMQSYLAATGLDVVRHIEDGSLILTSDQSHLRDGKFDIDSMMNSLSDALHQALADGYAGLWATGDMSWEFGPEREFAKLLQYELRLEDFILDHPQMGGVCQYHADTLPHDCLLHGLVTHPMLFVNDTLSRVNPNYARGDKFVQKALQAPDLHHALGSLLRPPD